MLAQYLNIYPTVQGRGVYGLDILYINPLHSTPMRLGPVVLGMVTFRQKGLHIYTPQGVKHGLSDGA